jgi:CubicO group peptidase (beta-lactamase class C family)
MAGPALRVFTQARNERRWMGIEIVPAAGDTARIAEFGLHPMDDPRGNGPPQPWATGALADEQVAAVIRERVRQAADSDRFAGVVLVAHGDRVLVHEPLGLADRARGVPNGRETTFQTTSVGKMFTGVAVMQLVQQGKLRLDDTVARVLPAYPNRDAAARITVRQLLTHTAGVPEPFLDARFGAAPAGATHAELLATFADAPLEGTPGAEHHYSNGNYATLAAIVERVSGERYEDYLRRHVWGPAGMRHVEHPAWQGTPDRAVGYARFTHLDPLGVEARTAAPVRAARGTLRGFGGGAYTAEDLFRFARALRTGKLLRADLVDSATTGRVDIMPGAPVKYAFGFYDQRMNGARIVGHPGSNPDTGFDADLEMVWDGDWTVVVLSNYDAPAGMMLAGPILDLLGRQGGARGTASR